MNLADTGRLHGQYATNYDQLTRDYACYAAEVVFGLLYEYVIVGDCLLDVGIGTGLSAAPFAKAGLTIFGFDLSEEMLAVCRAKRLAFDLTVGDLTDTPWPYAPQTFDHVAACGVLHFVEELRPFFRGAAEVLRPGGLAAFTTKTAPELPHPVVPAAAEGEPIPVFLHRRAEVEDLAAAHGFNTLKVLRFYVGQDLFDAFVMQCG